MTIVRDLVRRLGVDVVRYPVHTTLEGHLIKVLSEVGATTVLDVGANVGQFGTKLRDHSRFSGRIVSFEPHDESRRALIEAASGDPLWDVSGVGLGAADGPRKMNTFASSDWNSLHEADEENLAVAGRRISSPGTVDVHVRRLDGMWLELGLEDETVFLKSDTQGHDLQVLEGAGDHLKKVQGLLVEASVVPFYIDEPTLADLLSRITSLGFAPSGIFPVARRKNSIALTTVDVCFVKIP